MIVKRTKDGVFLFDDKREQDLARSIDTANEILLSMVTEISEANYPTDKDYLFGVCKVGSKYITDQEEKRVRDWTKKSPLAEASIRRLVEEAVLAVPSELLLFIDRGLGSIGTTLNNNPVANWRDYLEYTSEGRVWLSKKYYDDNNELLHTKITPEEMEDVKEFIELITRLRKLNDKGYRINNSSKIILGGRSVQVNGILGDLLGDRNEPDKRPELTEDIVLLSMESRLDLTFEEYNKRKAERRLC